jgi:hypothetical protein
MNQETKTKGQNKEKEGGEESHDLESSYFFSSFFCLEASTVYDVIRHGTTDYRGT